MILIEENAFEKVGLTTASFPSSPLAAVPGLKFVEDAR